DGPGFTADVVHTDRRHLSNALFLLADRLKAVAETNWVTLLTRVQEHVTLPAAPPDDPRVAAAAKLKAALYGDHPYGRRVRARDLMALDPDLAPVWLPRLYSPRNAVLVVVGDIDVEATERLAAGWFADWRGARDAAALAPPAVPPPAETAAGARARETVLVTARPVASQIEVTFACR